MHWTSDEFNTAFTDSLSEPVSILHRFEVLKDRWHVCYVDSGDDYHSNLYEWSGSRFTPISIDLGAIAQTELPASWHESEPTDGHMVERIPPELGTIFANGGHPEHVPDQFVCDAGAL